MATMKVDRRKFLAGVAGAGAASTVAVPHSAAADLARGIGSCPAPPTRHWRWVSDATT